MPIRYDVPEEEKIKKTLFTPTVLGTKDIQVNPENPLGGERTLPTGEPNNPLGTTGEYTTETVIPRPASVMPSIAAPSLAGTANAAPVPSTAPTTPPSRDPNYRSPLYTNEGYGPYSGPGGTKARPDSNQVITAPTLPGTGIISRGKFGEPLLTNKPGVESQVLPPAGQVLNAKKGSLIESQGRGTVPGGQVITPTMDAETAKLVAERQAAIGPAQESYNRTLDEANIMEGAHGTREAQRARTFIAEQRNKRMDEYYKKYGIDLKGMELQATIPKLAAETELAKAHANYYNAGGPGGSSNSASAQEQQYLDMSKGYVYQLTHSDPFNPMTPEKEKEIQGYLDNIDKKLEEFRSRREAKQPKTTGNKPTPDQITAGKQRIRELTTQGYKPDQIKGFFDEKGLNYSDFTGA